MFKRICTLLAVALLVASHFVANAQVFENNKVEQYYFWFSLKQGDDLRLITSQISIDNVRNDTVWAYATTAQFAKFLTTGRQINLLPQPGILPDVAMSDDFEVGGKATWNYYPTYEAYESLMAQFQATYPALCQVTTIATLASGRKLLVAKISDNVAANEAEPEFLYSSSMHGDETTGYILMLHLIDYLLANYGSNAEITNLVNSLEIYIAPLANPDGTYYGGNSSVSGAIRYNANGVDLNRNYPDPQNGQHPDGNAWQAETIAFMDFATAHHFSMGANFHGGIELVNYPWDTWATLAADDNWWYFVSREYVDTVHLHSPTTYMDDENNGVTNGYAWYEANGGRQDYMNYFHNCREVTIELSATKLLPAAQLETHWNYNYRSFILYLKQALYGIQGTITDGSTGLPIQAQVFIAGHDIHNSQVYSAVPNGDYHRYLKAGTYELTVSASGYQTLLIPNVVVNDRATTNLNIQLWPAPADPVSFSATSVGTNQINLSWAKNAANNDVMVVWSTSSIGVPTGGTAYSVGSSIPGGGTVLYNGPATSYEHTSLLTATTYNYKAFSKSSINTYSSGLTAYATTGCGTIATLPHLQAFANTTIPACWTQVDNQGNGQVWQFGTILGQSPNPILSGNYAYLNSDAYGSGNTQNADLISPQFDLSAYTNVNLQFQHYFKAYTGSSGKVYYSLNNGSTWVLISTFTTTSTLNPSTFNQTIAALAGQSQVKFKWNYTGTWAYYWAIDNIQVSGTVVNTLSVAPLTQAVTAEAGNTNFNVSSNTSWGVTSNATWCTVNPSGTGNGTITATFQSNPATLSRTAQLTVTATGLTPIVLTVVQDGAIPSLAITPTSITASEAAGMANYSISSNSAWTATCPESWVTITSSGNGNGTLQANYLQNTGASREASITVNVNGLSPVDVLLKQLGAEPSNFPSDFTAANITLNWIDANGGVLPDAYLVRMSSQGFSSIAMPIDGVEIPDGITDLNVAYGVQTAHFTNLLPNTTYYFKLFAYTGSGSLIDYKTDGAIPQVQLTTSPQ